MARAPGPEGNAFMRKRLVAPVLALTAAVALGGCAESNGDLEGRVADLESRVQALESAGSGASEEKPADDGATSQEAEKPTCSVTIDDVSFENDYSGKDRIVIVSMAFTNSGDKATSFSSSVVVSAYQDGAELDTGMPESWALDLPQTWEDRGTQVTPGTTIDVANAWTLRSSSPVTIEVTALGGDEVIATKTVDVA